MLRLGATYISMKHYFGEGRENEVRQVGKNLNFFMSIQNNNSDVPARLWKDLAYLEEL